MATGTRDLPITVRGEDRVAEVGRDHVLRHEIDLALSPGRHCFTRSAEGETPSARSSRRRLGLAGVTMSCPFGPERAVALPCQVSPLPRATRYCPRSEGEG